VLVLQIKAWLVNDLVICSLEFVVQMKPKPENQKLSYYLALFQFAPQVMIQLMLA